MSLALHSSQNLHSATFEPQSKVQLGQARCHMAMLGRLVPVLTSLSSGRTNEVSELCSKQLHAYAFAAFSIHSVPKAKMSTLEIDSRSSIDSLTSC